MPPRDQILANAKIVVRELTSAPDPLPLVSACAVAGNGWQENLMQPVTAGVRDHGSDGLLQWRLARLGALKRIPGWSLLPVQCRFFKAECKADYPMLWAQLMNPGQRSIENLTANICDIYERPSASGRQIEKRIAYAKEVMALFNAPPEPQINVPASVPPELAKLVVSFLNNALGGTWSSIAGVLALLYALAVYKHVSIPNLPTDSDWRPWAVFGLTLIFAIGGVAKPTPVPVAEPQPAAPETPPMNPETVLKLLTILEGFVPIIEKVLTALPSIASDVESIKTDLAQPTASHPEIDQRVTDLIEKVNALTQQH